MKYVYFFIYLSWILLPLLKAAKSVATVVTLHMKFILRTVVWHSHLLSDFFHWVCRVPSVNKMSTFSSSCLYLWTLQALLQRLATEGGILYSHSSCVILRCFSTNVYQKCDNDFYHSTSQLLSSGRIVRQCISLWNVFFWKCIYFSVWNTDNFEDAVLILGREFCNVCDDLSYGCFCIYSRKDHIPIWWT